MPADDLLAAFLHTDAAHVDDLVHSVHGDHGGHVDSGQHGGHAPAPHIHGQEASATHFLAGPSRRRPPSLGQAPAASSTAPAPGLDPSAAANSPRAAAASFLGISPVAVMQPAQLADRRVQLRVAFGIWGLTMASSVGLFVRHVARLARKLAKKLDEEEELLCDSDGEEEAEEEEAEDAPRPETLRLHVQKISVHNRDYNDTSREAVSVLNSCSQNTEGDQPLAYY
mmetsp:Transcript_132461/g.411817  ORF Transcript_132461/g.411817 Transcript_132461/m.411817 type:complete len:226 (+) Transcript_132461:97-774(+)